MKKIILYIISILQLLHADNFETVGSFLDNSNSYESISMSGATTAWIKGVSSISSNPAGLAYLKGIGVNIGLGLESANVSNYNDTQFPYLAIAYGRKEPLIKGTALYAAIGLSYQSRSVANIDEWSINQNYEGQFNFTESATSVAIAIQLEPISFGLKWINYNQNFGDYGSHSSIDFFKPVEFGLQYNLTKKLKYGINISKVSEIGKYDYSIGKTKSGIAYILDTENNNLVSIDYEKTSNDNGAINIGFIKNNILNKISLSAGFKHMTTTENSFNQISFGASYKVISNMNFNIALKQGINNDIVNPFSRILYCSLSYNF